MTHVVVAATALLLAAGGCYNPTIADNQYLCTGPNRLCPIGFNCTAGGFCVRGFGDGGSDSDAGSSSDASVPDAGASDAAVVPPCTYGGQRAAGDPGHANVAFCPAAWAVEGIRSTPSCMRQPPRNGAGCSAADNCNFGWHVCVTETEVEAGGVTQPQCAGMAGFWATQQNSKLEPLPTPRNVCNATTQGNLVGCGTHGGGAVQCSFFDRVLTNVIGCNSNAWVCDITVVDSTSTTVKKNDAQVGGGVICCRD